MDTNNTNNNINGIIVLDKPSNYDSHQITAYIQKLLDVEKTGHAGILDPKVTGVFIIFLGKATKLAQYFLSADKKYTGIMHLHQDITLAKLKKAVKKFTGKIKQLPPVRSAVKRQEREREIYNFKVIEKSGKEVLFSVHCESGTYIRKLVHDLGIALGTGAHMLELRRTKESMFEEKNCKSVYDIVEAVNENKIDEILLPLEIITKMMPKIIVKDECLKKLYNGSPVYSEFAVKTDKFKKNELVSIITGQGKLVEIATAVLEGDVIAKPKTVLNNR